MRPGSPPSPDVRGQVLSFESWQEAAGVRGVLPTFQLVRTASMWRECNGPAFEVPPFRLWPGMVNTLRFIRDHVKARGRRGRGGVGLSQPGAEPAARAAPSAAPTSISSRSI